MAEARCREHWNHTSHHMALHASIHRDSRRRSSPYSPEEFNPYCQAKGQTVGKVSVAELKRILTGG